MRSIFRSEINRRISEAARFIIPDNETIMHFLVLLICLAISFGDIFFANNIQHDSSQAGRGGALACAISFFSLFINRSYGLEVFRLSAVTLPEIENRVLRLRGITSEENLSKRIDLLIDAIIDMIEVDLLGQKKQNFFIALSAGVGTIFWGFGDVFAELLMPVHTTPLVVQPIHFCLAETRNILSHQFVAICR